METSELQVQLQVLIQPVQQISTKLVRTGAFCGGCRNTAWDHAYNFVKQLKWWILVAWWWWSPAKEGKWVRRVYGG